MDRPHQGESPFAPIQGLISSAQRELEAVRGDRSGLLSMQASTLRSAAGKLTHAGRLADALADEIEAHELELIERQAEIAASFGEG